MKLAYTMAPRRGDTDLVLEGLAVDLAARGLNGRLATCLPVVEYGREVQKRAAEELDKLPDGSAIAEMLADYSVVREQARACH